MDINTTKTGHKPGGAHRAAGLAAALGLLLAGAALADDPLSMAPPVDGAYSQGSYSGDGGSANGSADAAQDSVFQWTEVPQGQQVPIRRAVFDQGGYQLYDEKGETIVVPFVDHNLYAMKFAPSDNGSFYFVNDGDAPILYVPRSGYLENASVPGARWYPFSEEFHPTHPVFLGIAPSWHEFCDMGWYSDMRCHGGYYCDGPFISVNFCRPTFGLFFVIGGHHCDGWNDYHDYCDYHPAPYHVTVVNTTIYNNTYNRDNGNRYSSTRGSYPGGPWRPLGGSASRAGATHTFGQGRVYTGRLPDNGRTFGSERPLLAHRTFSGDVRSISGSHTFGSDRAVGADRAGTMPSQGSGRPFGGASPSGEAHTYSQGRTYGSGRVFEGGRPASDSSPRTYGSSGGTGRVFGGGRTTATEGARFPSSNGGGSRTYGNSGDSGRTYSSHTNSSGGSGERTYSPRPSGESSRASNNNSGRTSNDAGNRPSNTGGGRSFGSGYRPR